MPTTVEVFVERRPSRAGSTDEAAFADLYARTYSSLVAYCRRYCPPGYDAEDIAQEAFSRAWTSWDRYSPSRPFWPWVATIARRLCVDYWRRDERSAARDGRAVVLEPQGAPCPDEVTETAEECRLAVGAFRRLRPDHQRIVGLRDIEGWSYEDIARFEGVTVESVRGSLRRARVSLRKSYEHVARGLPIVFVLRGFKRVKLRVTERLAELQGHSTRTGASSAGVAEWLVTVVAVTVAASGLGGGAASAPRPTAPAPPATAESAPAGAESAPGTDATAQAPSRDGAQPPTPAATGSGAAPAGGGSAPPTWLTPPATPDEMVVTSITPSPNYEKDHTVFAAGRGAFCGAPCYVLFKSTDRGKTWEPLPATGLVGETLLLPPAYGAGDQRLFATNGVVLQVSTDGKRFDTIAPAYGGAFMSPEFSSGDPRILFSASPLWEYDDPTRTVAPMALTPPPPTTSADYSLAYAADYRTSHAIYVAGTDSLLDYRQGATVYRCVVSSCGPATRLPGGAIPRLHVPRGAAPGTVFAWTEAGLFRSTDGAATFQPADLALDSSMEAVAGVTDDGRGQLYAFTTAASPEYAARVFRSADGGRTWAELVSARSLGAAISALTALPDGRILVAVAGPTVGLRCSADGGRSWARRC